MPSPARRKHAVVTTPPEHVVDPFADQARAVAEAMLDPLLVLAAVRDADGTIADFGVTFTNSAFAALYGVNRTTFDGHRLLDVLPEYRESGLFAAFAAVTETGDPYRGDEFSFDGVGRDGLPYRYAIDLRAVRVGDGVAATALHAQAMAPGASLPEARASYLRERAAQGPWAEPWIGRPEDGDYGLALTAAGVQAMAYAPLLHGGTVVGILSIGTTSAGSAHRFEEQLPTAIEFAATARSLLAAQLTERRDTRSVRSEISAVLAAGTFRAVFQPIVDMSTAAAIGYEALTRFDDGTPPDRRFAAARRSGLGLDLDLEAATLERAVNNSMLLPAGPWLALNVTAEMIMDGTRLAGVLRRRTRPVVLEITEHDAIDDYQAVRAAVASLGPDVRIAVDDVGAGVANFTHIVQLRPDFVKIDASLVRGVNSDLTRQALIVGLHHFARATNGWIIAEGVETEEERVTLRALDLNFGQGYHFGRPAPAEAWERPQPEPAQRPASVV